MGQVLRVIAGADGGPWQATLRNEGTPVAFAGSATFLATVSRGGEGASLFAPAVSWVDPAAGTFRLSVDANQTAALDAGSYLLQVFVLDSGEKIEAFDGTLEVLPTVGNVAARVPYCSDEDMRRRYDQLGMLANRSNDTTGFLDVRAEASDDLDRWLVRRYLGRPGYTMVRHNTTHPVLGTLDWSDPTATPPSKKAITAALAAGGLVLERAVREIVALRSIAMILERQEVEAPNSFRQEAQAMRQRAEEIGRCYQAQVTLDAGTYPQASSYPSALIGVDATLLPPGTSP